MDKLRMMGLEQDAVVLELGARFTKCGYAGEYIPRHILPTPRLLAERGHSKETYVGALQEFLHIVYFHKVQAKPKEGPTILVEKLLAPRELIEAIATVLFENLQVPVVYFALEESLPLYVTGGFTGLCVDLGYQRTSVLPIYEGVPLMLAASFAEEASGKKVLETLGRCLGGDLDIPALEDIVVRLALVPFGDLTTDCRDPSNQSLMEERKYRCRPVGTHADVQLSFLDRILPESVLFGDIDSDQENIAATVLDAVAKSEMVLRKVLINNLVVSGGLCMVPGVLERLMEEMLRLLNHETYSTLRPLKPFVNILDTEFSRNLLVWTGGSIFGSLPALERFSLAREDFLATGVPDRIGENYLFASRKSVQEIHNTKDKSFDRLKDSLLAS